MKCLSAGGKPFRRSADFLLIRGKTEIQNFSKMC
jgi:hypothetical protein